MKKLSSIDREPGNSQGAMVVGIGSHCPANGLWRPLGSSAEAIFVFEGSIMPAHDGGSAMWTLVDAGDRSRGGGVPALDPEPRGDGEA
ncbi:hypothetical protein [Arthrobacter sp. NyZ413]|uniref:hypothetical protein n=1 Tax=Arthrobacter sp. NyZ413 TaxID=3144669 RepID=UPI003BF7F2B4